MKITTANKKSIEVSDSTFSAPFNEALVHQVVNAVLSGARSGTKAQKIDLKFLVGAQNHGDKKVLVEQEQEQSEVQSGLVGEEHLQQGPEISRKK